MGSQPCHVCSRCFDQLTETTRSCPRCRSKDQFRERYQEQLVTDQGLAPEADGFDDAEDESDGPEERLNAWEASPTGGTGKVEIKHVRTGKVYLVARAQMSKAQKALDPASCLSALGEACGCSKACNMQFSSVALLRARASIHTLADEQAKSTALAAYMKTGQCGGQKCGFLFEGKVVCRKFISTAFMVSENKIRKASHLVRNPDNPLSTPVPTLVAAIPETPLRLLCETFWGNFFEECSQTSDEKTYYFPVNQSTRLIYSTTFNAWVRRNEPNAIIPSLSTFKKARKRFKNVKKRKNHHHTKCATCKALEARMLKSYDKTGFVSQALKDELTAHKAMVSAWRYKEQYWINKAKHTPSEVNTFQFDDTEAVGLPHFTNRTYKGLPAARADYVPFLIHDHARNKKMYVFSRKGLYPKGANRLVTTLLACITALKLDTSSEARHARKLVLIGDNYSENKNNTIIAFAQDLLLRRVYDEDEMLYGQVGHTHNGIDQAHNVFNNTVKSYTLGDLAQVIKAFPLAWTNTADRPEAVLLEAQYDWDKYYSKCIRPLAGFTATPNDDIGVHGFKFYKNEGVVEMRWKRDAGGDSEWRGEDGYANSEAFVLLRSRPNGEPEVIPKAKFTTNKEYFRQFAGQKIAEAMEAEGISGLRDDLMQAFSTGLTPRGDAVDDAILPGFLGRRFKLGKPPFAQVVVSVIDTVPTGQSVWSFVKDCVPELPRLGIGAGDRATAAAVLATQRLPNVGYADVPAKQRPMYKHPNNVAHRGRMALVADQEDPALGPLSPPEDLILAQLPARGKRVHTGPGLAREKTTRQRKQSKRSDSHNDLEEVAEAFGEVAAQAVFPFAEPPIPRVPGPHLPEVPDHHHVDKGRGRSERNIVSRNKAGKQVTHDVFAEFGGEEKAPEVWLFVKSGRGNIQYLTQEGLGDKWGVTQLRSHQSFSQKTALELIEKVFKNVLFDVSGVGKYRTTITTKPFDRGEWDALVQQSRT